MVSAEVNELETQARSFEPHLIICSEPRIVNSIDALGWIELSPYPHQRSKIWIEERYEEATNLGIGGIISVVDEVGELVGDQDP